MTPARDAAIARQAQELAEGEVVSTELPIVRELREENARLREAASLWRTVSNGAGVYVDADGQLVFSRVLLSADEAMDDYGDAREDLPTRVRDLIDGSQDSDEPDTVREAILAARAAEGATDEG